MRVSDTAAVLFQNGWSVPNPTYASYSISSLLTLLSSEVYMAALLGSCFRSMADEHRIARSNFIPSAEFISSLASSLSWKVSTKVSASLMEANANSAFTVGLSDRMLTESKDED